MKYLLSKAGFWLLLGLGLGMRLYFFSLPGSAGDDFLFQIWAQRLLKQAWGRFYDIHGFCDYPPLFLYCLAFWGKLASLYHQSPLSILFSSFLKFTEALADLGSAALIYGCLKRVASLGSARLGFLLYWLNPGIAIDSSLWGQTDSLLTLGLLGVFTLLQAKRHFIAGFLFGLCYCLKYQAVMALPAFLVFCQEDGAWNGIGKMLGGTLVGFLPTLPFVWRYSPWWIFSHFREALSEYRSNCLKAFNLWSGSGYYSYDDSLFLGFTAHFWGMLLLGAALLFLWLRYRSQAQNRGQRALWLALSLWAAYLFPTRVHERYLFPFFVFMTLASVENPGLLVFLFIASLLYAVDVFYTLCGSNRVFLVFAGEPVYLFGGALMTALFVAAVWRIAFQRNTWLRVFGCTTLLLVFVQGLLFGLPDGRLMQESVQRLFYGHLWQNYLFAYQHMALRWIQSAR